MDPNDRLIEKAREEQAGMLELLESQAIVEYGGFQPTDYLASLDVQYVGENAYVGIDLVSFSGKLNFSFVSKEACSFPYLPGYFAFREGPVLMAALNKLKKDKSIVPALLLIDGHGIAHPRKMGVATWVGIKAGIPSLGVAKDPLLRQDYDLEEKKGSHALVYLKGEVVGMALRTQDGIKPLFVSPGYRLNLETAKKVALSQTGNYRNLEPIRRADQAARAYAKDAPLEESIILS